MSLTLRVLAQQLDAALATVIEESARKDARIEALEQENALLLALLAQARAEAGARARHETDATTGGM